MITERNTFTGGKMNQDADDRLLPKGQYRTATNIRVANSEGSDVGAIEKVLSNTQLTNLSFSVTPYTLGSISDTFNNRIYWCVKDSNGSYVIEYDVNTDTTSYVLRDERVTPVLEFNENYRVQMVLIIDSDNDNVYLGFTDYYTQPKLINIERAKTYGLDGFNEEMILLIKKPPLYAPTLSLSDTGNKENHIEERFITISYRYKYLDGMFSALSPQSEHAFDGKPFSYRFSTSTNESMVNVHNSIAISFNTGTDLVTDIELVYKESGSNNLYVIESFNKAEKGWSDDSIETFTFTNNKRYKLLPEDELFRLYDNVPLLAKSIAVINNRIVFGNYTENFNLVDCEDNPLSPDYTLEKVQTTITSGTATRSLKTNRDYEIARVYLDDYGRMTTPLTSDTNTIRFDNDECTEKNQIKIVIPDKAPCFAKYMRLFIKESKQEYETIIPTLFFFQSNYIYFYIQPSDVDKVKENDFLIVKADTEGILNDIIKLKVLEVARKDENFISDTDGGQPEGFYIKTSIQNEDVIFDPNSYTFYRHASYDQSEGGDAIISEQTDYVSTLFKGDTLDDLTANSLFSGSVDLRYEVEIFTIGAADTFRWRTQDVDGTFSSWDDNTGAGYTITGVSQALDADVDITFGATTGHSNNDKWLVKVNKGFSADEDNHSYARYVYPDTITIGSIITLKYYSKKEKSSDIDSFLLEFVSSGSYENLEEWYYGDEIYTQILSEPDFDQSLDNFWFRDIDVSAFILGDEAFYTNYTVNPTGTAKALFIKSRRDSRNSSRDVYSDVYIEVRSLEQLPIFENEIPSEDVDLDQFFEIGRTYVIDDDGYHIGFDVSDTDQELGVDAEFILPIFNCISWGNGFESYKIRDEFNARTMKLDSRSSTPVEDYKKNIRIADYTYGGKFEQTTNYNGLNEFNLSRVNFRTLDDAYGSIQRMVPWDGDVDIYQEDKVSKVFYDKSVIYDGDGNSTLSSTDRLFGATVPYSGEFGISTNPESLAVYGNYTYWADQKRGVVLRKGRSGIEIISNFGMRDWFRDVFRTGDTTSILGGYDTYYGQYIINVDDNTLSFDEKVKGWTSFHSYLPDAMVALNNKFYTFYLGQLWEQYSREDYNYFYNIQYDSTITTVFNENHNIDKIYKAFIIESSNAWAVSYVNNLSLGEVLVSEFTQKESRWFAYLRQNESASDINGRSQGIGNIVAEDGLTVTFGQISDTVSIGDSLFQINSGLEEEIGEISNIDRETGVITVLAIVNTPVVANFGYSIKNARIEGSEIRGYYLEATLTDTSSSANELFALNVNLVKSYV